MQSFLESSPSLFYGRAFSSKRYIVYIHVYTQKNPFWEILFLSLFFSDWSLRTLLPDWPLASSFLPCLVFELPIPLCVRFIQRPTFLPFSPISISFVSNFRGLGISEFFHRTAPRVRNEHETTDSECNRRKTATVLAKRSSTPVTTILQLWMIYSRIVCKHFRVTPPDLDKPPDACPFSFNLWTFRVYIEDFAKKAYAKPRLQYHFCLATI